MTHWEIDYYTVKLTVDGEILKGSKETRDHEGRPRTVNIFKIYAGDVNIQPILMASQENEIESLILEDYD
jgi:hypothetical protein